MTVFYNTLLCECSLTMKQLSASLFALLTCASPWRAAILLNTNSICSTITQLHHISCLTFVRPCDPQLVSDHEITCSVTHAMQKQLTKFELTVFVREL